MPSSLGVGQPVDRVAVPVAPLVTGPLPASPPSLADATPPPAAAVPAVVPVEQAASEPAVASPQPPDIAASQPADRSGAGSAPVKTLAPEPVAAVQDASPLAALPTETAAAAGGTPLVAKLGVYGVLALLLASMVRRSRPTRPASDRATHAAAQPAAGVPDLRGSAEPLRKPVALKTRRPDRSRDGSGMRDREVAALTV